MSGGLLQAALGVAHPAQLARQAELAEAGERRLAEWHPTRRARDRQRHREVAAGLVDAHATHDVGWLAVSLGTLRVAGARVSREMVIFEEGNQAIEVVAEGDVDFVIASAVKHRHSLVTGMYSVHTSPKNLVIGESGIRDVASSMSLMPWRPLAESLGEGTSSRALPADRLTP